MKNFKRMFIILAGLILSIGCGMFSMQPGHTKIPPMTVTVAFQTATSPATPLPVVSTATITPTIAPALTDVSPTLSSTQIAKTILDLYTNNGSCELPCWWGIIPRETSIQDVHSRFSKFGEFREDTRSTEKLLHYGFTLVPPDEIDKYKEGLWSFQLVIENNIVVGITAPSYTNRLFSNPSWATFLSAFGEPREIWLSVTEHRDGPPSYDMVLFYPQIGILVMGSGDAHVITKTETNIKVSICPQEMPQTINMINHYPPGLVLWSPNEQKSFSEINAEHLLEQPYRLFDASMTDMANNQFYNTYLDPAATQCFDVSWPWNPR